MGNELPEGERSAPFTFYFSCANVLTFAPPPL